MQCLLYTASTYGPLTALVLSCHCQAAEWSGAACFALAEEYRAAVALAMLQAHTGFGEEEADTCCRQNEPLRVRAGRGVQRVLRKQAENAVEVTTDGTAEREWEYAWDEDSGVSKDVAEQTGAAVSPAEGVQQNEAQSAARSTCVPGAVAAAQAAAG